MPGFFSFACVFVDYTSFHPYTTLHLRHYSLNSTDFAFDMWAIVFESRHSILCYEIGWVRLKMGCGCCYQKCLSKHGTWVYFGIRSEIRGPKPVPLECVMTSYDFHVMLHLIWLEGWTNSVCETRYFKIWVIPTFKRFQRALGDFNVDEILTDSRDRHFADIH